METNEISIHEARFYAVLRNGTGGWTTHRELAEAASIAERTARAYTLKFVKLGILDLAEVFPCHRYRLSDKAARRNAAYINRLIQACDVFGLSLNPIK